jgi:multiple sugar transport system permease protein
LYADRPRTTYATPRQVTSARTPLPTQRPYGEPIGSTRPRRRSKTRHKGIIFLLLAPFCTLFLLFYLLPIGYSLYESFLKIKRIGPFGPPMQVYAGLHQYERVAASREFWSSIARMLLFFCISAPIQLGLAVLFALLLDSPLVRGKKFFRLALFAPYAVPGVIAALMWEFLYAPSLSPVPVLAKNFDLLGSGLVIFSIANVVNWIYMGYNMLIINAALRSIPSNIIESARIDGAGQIRIAWSIKIPMIVPAFILTAVISIIGTLQLFNEPTVFRTFSNAVTSKYTPNMIVYATSNIPDYSLAAAYSTVLALATCILSFAFLKTAQRRASR